MAQQVIHVLKASGQLAPFDSAKLRKSLHKAGADAGVIDKILEEIKLGLYDGISTYKIYQKAFDLLRARSKPTAAKYKLKNAIMELGPSGYPFEKYFAELLAAQGYKVKTNLVLDGKCVTHEVDVQAEVDNLIHFIECKFHNSRGYVTDVKISLYVHSRFIDLRDKQSLLTQNTDKHFKGWVVTNTKFSTDAIQYGQCAGLELIAWDFPEGKGIRDMIEKTGLHPVTCLTTLTNNEKQTLLNEKVIVCKDLIKNVSVLENMGIKPNRLKNILAEAGELCGGR